MCNCEGAVLTERGIISPDAWCTLKPGLQRMSQTEEEGEVHSYCISPGLGKELI